MKIFKSDCLGVLFRNFRWSGSGRLAVGMIACFEFDKSNRTGLLREPELWARTAAAMGSDAILDEAWPKPAGEFLVFGSAFSLAGAQVEEVAVSARLGNLEKSLFVRGDRHFNTFGMMSSPKPFASMPIAPATAYGGASFAANPHGKGVNKVRLDNDANVLPLPNVESASQPILRAGDVAPPAGFWSYPPEAPERTRHLGAFDQSWLKNTWPHLPDTTSTAYFQTAPMDQRLGGFFAGDEAITLRNMHPSQPNITTSLPKLRARCFINRRVADGEEFLEIESRAETVWLFPELSCGIVLYRAVVNTAQEDADDVLHLMAEWESMSDAPLPISHYHDEFLRQTQRAVSQSGSQAMPPATASTEAGSSAPPAVAVALPASLAPLAAAAAVPLAGKSPPLVSTELQEVHRLADELNQNSQQLMQKHGITQADLAPFMKPEVETPPHSLEEIHKLAADLQANSREVMAQHKLTDKDLEPFMPKPEVQSTDPVGDLAKALTELNANTQAVMAEHGITPADVALQMSKNPELAGLPVNPTADIQGIMAALAAVMPAAAPPKLKMPDIAPPSPEVAPAVTVLPKLTREDVVARHARGQSFVSQDLSGLDLSALNLAGADFSGALLEKTNFKNSRLAGSLLKDALLTGGDFSGADLSGAVLTGVSAGSTHFLKASMLGVDASKADFTGADFSQAQMTNANIDLSLFDGAKMVGLKAASCCAKQTSFADCDLTGVDLTDARLTAAVFNNSKLGKAKFVKSFCENAEFYGADATQADFTHANLKASRADATSQFAGAQLVQSHLARANWPGVMMAGARLDGAVLDDADFSRVQAADASFVGVSAKGSKFDKSDLSRADFTGVNLFKGSLRYANTEATRLQKANLYGVDFYGCAPTIASLEGSNIDQTLLLIRKPGI